MGRHIFVTHSPEKTIELGRRIARQLRPPVVVLLIGELGAGKTTLAKGLVAGLGAASEEEVTSPTFTLVHEYGSASENAQRVYHVDLYRVETPRDLETLGLEDLMAERAVVLVEWGEKLGPAFRAPWLAGRLVEIHLEAANDTERRIEFHSPDETSRSGRAKRSDAGNQKKGA
ncbi:MAG: tRNA (adenosine(37)-N6)-threonylcarbamoyltransferase complex ATPase subunit type 1 TsaE [Acidobacteria bacterium]|nr:tRNA (adenosine(37)-N6)-threonylcarbamoyltransferase complex ATPase subunit type 1 TsaE [Acidobacteriota bacterium]